MGHSETWILEEHLHKITDKPGCTYCRRSLADVEKADRGVVEFFDGWFWICPACRLVVGDTFDQTQCLPWYHTQYPPYFQKSRRYWAKWFEDEYGMVFDMVTP